MIDSEKIKNSLNTNIFGKKIYSFESIDSTNDCAKALAEIGAEEGTVIISEIQTKGKGRHGRNWFSEEGKNLLFSVVFKPEIPSSQIALLTFFASLSVIKVLRIMLPNIEVKSKWPNDLLINGKKICGILLESSTTKEMDFVIAGIGINVNQEYFPEDIIGTSIKNEIGTETDRENILINILNEFDMNYNAFLLEPKNTIKEWKEYNILQNSEIKIETTDSVHSGKVIDVDELGRLILEVENKKIMKFFSGDVTISK